MDMDRTDWDLDFEDDADESELDEEGECGIHGGLPPGY